MVSKTKYKIDDAAIVDLFTAAGIAGVTEIAPLGAGEFNAVFSAEAGGKAYVLKIAPTDDAPTLRYEKDMMASEIHWYEKMRTHTPIRVPAVYFTDFSRKIIPADYFIMEKLPGKTLDQVQRSKEEKAESSAALAEMVAQMHRVKGERFGYLQTGLHDSWYRAIRAMTCAIMEDCKDKGKRTKRGQRLLRYIDANKAVLEQAECCMVNFDIWEPNIMCQRVNGQLQYAWIDPERGYWGDPIVDFVCLEMMTPLAQKKTSLRAYNKAAEHPVHATQEECIRYAVAQGYLGVLMEVEKYYRYTWHHFGWWRNVFACAWLFKSAFKVLQDG